MIIDGFLGDRLYSVTLDEDEYALFSELEQREFVSVRNAKKSAKLTGQLYEVADAALRKEGTNLAEAIETEQGEKFLDQIFQKRRRKHLLDEKTLNSAIKLAQQEDKSAAAKKVAGSLNKIKDKFKEVTRQQ